MKDFYEYVRFESETFIKIHIFEFRIEGLLIWHTLNIIEHQGLAELGSVVCSI